MKLNFVAGLLCGTLVTASISITFFTLRDSGQTLSDDSHELNAPISKNQNRSEGGFSSAKQASVDNALDSNPQSTTVAFSQKNLIRDTENSALCDGACVNKLVTKFIDGDELSSEDWDNIRDNGQGFALSISNDADAVRSLRDKITYATEIGEIDGLMTVVSSLPDDMALDIVRDVSSYSNTHKALALQTLSGMSVYSQNAAREIENLVIGERDPQVISAALNALETTDNYEFSPQVWQSLSSQFTYVEDTQLKGSILLSLAKHGKGDATVLTNNVEEGLNSMSSDFQMASIEALGYLISRSENEEMLRSGGLKSQLTAIADNSDANTSVRIEALRLLDGAF